MLELITTVAIIAGSIALLLYWFHYSCLLIISAQAANDYAEGLAQAKGLQFLAVQAQLRTSSTRALHDLDAVLDCDYALLRTILDKSARDVVQDSMLGLHYQAARACYAITSAVCPSAARLALGEMATVVAYFANAAGEAAAAA